LQFLLGGLSCAITSYLVAVYLGKPSGKAKKRLYACISGIGAMAIAWLGWRVFPSTFEPHDSIPLGIMVGLFGLGRVLDTIARKYGIEERENDPKI
jgi:hypothetical protein